jgi:hypothetical protein
MKEPLLTIHVQFPLFKQCMNAAFIPEELFNDRLVRTSETRPPFYAKSVNWGSVKLSLNPWTFSNRSTWSFTTCMVRECGAVSLWLAQPTRKWQQELIECPATGNKLIGRSIMRSHCWARNNNRIHNTATIESAVDVKQRIESLRILRTEEIISVS